MCDKNTRQEPGQTRGVQHDTWTIGLNGERRGWRDVGPGWREKSDTVLRIRTCQGPVMAIYGSWKKNAAVLIPGVNRFDGSSMNGIYVCLDDGTLFTHFLILRIRSIWYTAYSPLASDWSDAIKWSRHRRRGFIFLFFYPPADGKK